MGTAAFVSTPLTETSPEARRSLTSPPLSTSPANLRNCPSRIPEGPISTSCVGEVIIAVLASEDLGPGCAKAAHGGAAFAKLICPGKCVRRARPCRP